MFETIFKVGSIHEGTITEMLDKGAVVSLPYGVEGFATPKHLVKEDGTQAKKDEKLPFKVIEFNKDAKRIILSHSRIYEDKLKDENRKSHRSNRREEEPVINNNLEKTTLGDISQLAELKAKLEKGEQK